MRKYTHNIFENEFLIYYQYTTFKILKNRKQMPSKDSFSYVKKNLCFEELEKYDFKK